MIENQADTANEPKKKMSKLALVSFVFTIIGVLLIFTLLEWTLSSLPGFILVNLPFIIGIVIGIIAILHIHKNKENLKGEWLVWTSFLIFIFFGLRVDIFIMTGQINIDGKPSPYAEIRTELSQISLAAQEYYTDNSTYIGLKEFYYITLLVPPKCSGDNYTIQISPDGKKYLAYANLCYTEKDTFWCVDSEGFAGEIVADNIPDDIYFCPSNPK